ncbi:MAG: GTPase Era [Nitriliruptorales bacterium]|nr:GTPase Era [Nitriliruptorales bacterium]
MSRELDLDAILAGAEEPLPPGHRSGLVALVGRPNVGKSTLLNAMVGQKVAIVTDVPGTTRNAIRGVVTRDDAQIVFLDTPGVMKPRTLLSRRLNDLVRETWTAVDVICFVVDAAAGVGRGDEFLAGELSKVATPKVAVANKEDLVADKHALIPELARLEELGDFLEVVPTSATTGLNVEHLEDLLVERLPEGGRMFPAGEVTDQPESRLVAEILREKVIGDLREELPHSVAVEVEHLEPSPDRDDLLEIDAVIFVERESQKGIVIGRGGRRLRAAGTEARHEIERLLGSQVHLSTHVKVAKNWQTDPKQLGRFGY